MDDILALVKKTRSVRRFDGARALTEADLRGLVELARLSPCAGNKQVLRFRLVHGADACAAVFPALGWAGYLKDWDGPEPAERPTGYIVILRDTRSPFPADEGIAAQSIFLGAAARGLAGCFIGCVDRPALARALGFTADPALAPYEIALVIALGYPQENVVIEEMRPGDTDIKYWRDAQGGHHVPKRALDDLLL